MWLSRSLNDRKWSSLIDLFESSLPIKEYLKEYVFLYSMVKTVLDQYKELVESQSMIDDQLIESVFLFLLRNALDMVSVHKIMDSIVKWKKENKSKNPLGDLIESTAEMATIRWWSSLCRLCSSTTTTDHCISNSGLVSSGVCDWMLLCPTIWW